MKRGWMFLAVALQLALPISAAVPATADDAHGVQPIDAARRYVDAFLTGDTQTLLDHASAELKSLLKDAVSTRALRDQSVGKGAQSGDEQVAVILTRQVKSAGGQAFAIMAQVAADGQLVGFSIQPAGEAPSEFLEYQTKAKLRLPFDGRWTVFWGGRTMEQNHHVISAGQRFAYDLLQIRDGASHSGDGAKNEDYYCFGQPILAPAAGRVVAAVDGIADNLPGQMNPAELAGNHVVLDLGHDEFVFLAHLQQGSVAIKPGDRVAAGQQLGLCGNSGNSSEPHLHVHLQTTPDLASGKGLPLQFERYQADGQAVERGEPTKGQLVSMTKQAAPGKSERAGDAPQRSIQKSPFAAVRWQQSQPEVKVGGEWFKLVSLDGVAAAEIVAFSRRTYRDKWQMRFQEDLVDLLTRMGHPPGDKVTLVVQTLKTSQTKTLADVAMTAANREATKAAAQARGGGAVAEGQTNQPEPSDVDAKLRRRLVGRYQLNPNFIFDVRDRDGHLMVGITNQATQEVFPDSPTRWSYRGIEASLEFELAKTGPAKSLVLHQNGVQQTARRIK